jgi:hypothetical protein
MIVHDFWERLSFSKQIGHLEDLLEYLLTIIPGSVKWVKATKDEDRSGVDYWIVRAGLRPLAVDVKHREFDPLERWGVDDICIETTAVYVGPPKPPWLDEYRKVKGWTIDPQKRTDLIVYTWPLSNGGRRFWVVYFPFLCHVAQKFWRRWAAEYGEKAVRNRDYLTLCVFPPRYVVEEAIRQCIWGTLEPPISCRVDSLGQLYWDWNSNLVRNVED